MENRQNSTNINWFPGHMAKTRKQITEDLKLVDVVIEILDARIPISSQNPEIQKIIMEIQYMENIILLKNILLRHLHGKMIMKYYHFMLVLHQCILNY